MESEDGSLEDGEIVDYTPLERPSLLIAKNNYSNGTPNIDSSDEASATSSESDSDSEPNSRPKRQKLNKHKFRCTSKKYINKYNVWSIGLQEEALSEDLINCGVQKVDRSRDVETYDYQMKYRLHDDDDDDDPDQIKEDTEEETRQDSFTNNKRRHGEYKQQRHIRKRSSDRSGIDFNKHRFNRVIPELSVIDTDPPEEVAKDIVAKLSEKNEDLISRIVNVLGNKKAIELYNETKRIEDCGGMLIMNGSRRRTPGGVYLLLVKLDDDIPHEKIKAVFTDDREMTQQFRRRRRKRKKADVIKKSLLGDELLPTLLTRGELEVRKASSEITEGEHAVSNPPPSPATDCDNSETINVQPQPIVIYDDDFLQLNTADDELECF